MHLPTLIVFNWIFGIVGAVGIGGLIAMALLAPAVFTVVAKLIMDFLNTRLGLSIAVGVACLYGGLVYGDVSGRAEERTVFNAQQLKAEQEAHQRDVDAATSAAADAQKRIADLTNQQTVDEGKINDYETQLASTHSAVCSVTDADVQRLHDLEGALAASKVGGVAPARAGVPRASAGAGNKGR